MPLPHRRSVTRSEVLLWLLDHHDAIVSENDADVFFFVMTEHVRERWLVENGVAFPNWIENQDTSIAGVDVTFVFLVIAIVDPDPLGAFGSDRLLRFIRSPESDVDHVRRVADFDDTATQLLSFLGCQRLKGGGPFLRALIERVASGQ